MSPNDATPRSHPLAPARQWRWAWLGSIALVAACGAVLVPLQGRPVPAVADAHAAAERPRSPAPQAAAPRVADDTVTSPIIPTDDSPEGRLIAAYIAVGDGEGRKAMELAAALVRDHPEFSLAQMLYGDLLATRAGAPSSFGLNDATPDAAAGDNRLALREEALRRLNALRERPPVGLVPRDFVALPTSIRHAVAVDTSRSRLYLFSNGPFGLKLERDFYVSLGKQGVAKQVEGDRRTPLGVYWITAALSQGKLDERFGHAALRFNYPNAVDRLQGRTGTGLFLHGVPSKVLTHVPWATDGCVAMANEDVARLLRTLEVDTTPVVITRQLEWVKPEDAHRPVPAFEVAMKAWDAARRNADAGELAKWYVPDATVPPPADDADVGSRSIVAWNGGDAPMMVVTSHPKKSANASEAEMSRQYWVERDGQWRILFDGAVPVSEPVTARAAAEAPRRPAKARTETKARPAPDRRPLARAATPRRG